MKRAGKEGGGPSGEMSRQPMFQIPFEDGSVFRLPQDWEDVFADYYGQDPSRYISLEASVRHVTAKYIEHKAWPSNLDGIGMEDIEDDEAKLSNPDFYMEHWDEWGEKGRAYGKRTIHTPPSSADVAEAVMYQDMRPLLLQKTADYC